MGEFISNHPIKAAILIAFVTVIGGGILGGLGIAWLENLYKSVGLNKLVEAGQSIRKLGRLGAGTNPNPFVPVDPTGGSKDNPFLFEPA